MTRSARASNVATAATLGGLSSALLTACAGLAQPHELPLVVSDGGMPSLVSPETTRDAPSHDRPRLALRSEVRREGTELASSTCRVGRPVACDRCGEFPCRQVRVSPLTTPEDTRWAPFCAAGDIFEEAFIACLCGGGTLCQRAAIDTAITLDILRDRFGDAVPPVGTRYRDAYGLAAVVDYPTYTYLSAVAGPPSEIRCDAPDPETLEQEYDVLAQRVRATGRCDSGR